MVLKLLCAQVALTKLAINGAFTLGAVAGTAGVIGLYALRRAVKEKRMQTETAPATDGAI